MFKILILTISIFYLNRLSAEPFCSYEKTHLNAICNPSSSTPCPQDYDCLRVDNLDAQTCHTGSVTCQNDSECCSGTCSVSTPESLTQGQEVKKCISMPDFRGLYFESNPSCKIKDQSCSTHNECCSGTCEGITAGAPSQTGVCKEAFVCVKKTPLHQEICGVSKCSKASVPISSDSGSLLSLVQLTPLKTYCEFPSCGPLDPGGSACPEVVSPGVTSELMQATLDGTQCKMEISASFNQSAVEAEKYLLAFEYLSSTHELTGNYIDIFGFSARANGIGVTHQATRRGIESIFEQTVEMTETELNQLASNASLDPIGARSLELSSAILEAQAKKAIGYVDLYLKLKKDSDGNIIYDSEGNPSVENKGLLLELEKLAADIRNQDWGCRKIVSEDGLFKPCSCSSGVYINLNNQTDKVCMKVLKDGRVDPLMPSDLREINNPQHRPHVEQSFISYARNDNTKISSQLQYSISQDDYFSVNDGIYFGRRASLKDIAHTAYELLFFYGRGEKLPGDTKVRTILDLSQKAAYLGEYYRKVYKHLVSKADCLAQSANLRRQRFGGDLFLENSAAGALLSSTSAPYSSPVVADPNLYNNTQSPEAPSNSVSTNTSNQTFENSTNDSAIKKNQGNNNISRTGSSLEGLSSDLNNDKTKDLKDPASDEALSENQNKSATDKDAANKNMDYSTYDFSGQGEELFDLESDEKSESEKTNTKRSLASDNFNHFMNQSRKANQNINRDGNDNIFQIISKAYVRMAKKEFSSGANSKK